MFGKHNKYFDVIIRLKQRYARPRAHLHMLTAPHVLDRAKLARYQKNRVTEKMRNPFWASGQVQLPQKNEYLFL